MNEALTILDKLETLIAEADMRAASLEWCAAAFVEDAGKDAAQELQYLALCAADLRSRTASLSAEWERLYKIAVAEAKGQSEA